VQEEVGMGSSRVRAPRLALAGEELVQAKKVIDKAKEDWIPAYAGMTAKSSPPSRRRGASPKTAAIA